MVTRIIRSFAIVLVLTAIFSLSACSKSSGSSGGDGTGTGEFSDQDLALEQQRWAQDANIPLPEAEGLFRDIHFAYNSSEIPPEEQEKIRMNAEVLIADSQLHAEIEGHCDNRGTTDYNYALGERRARAVADMLVSFGARPAQLSTISYGEEIPLDPRNTEDAFAKNRRAHFALYRNKPGSS